MSIHHQFTIFYKNRHSPTDYQLSAFSSDFCQTCCTPNHHPNVRRVLFLYNGHTDHPIIHRDIKSTNILLTDQLRAKVADFGFARLAPDETEATHVSTMVKGTAGYVDPGYLRTNHLTDRSDVYSFGVLLVELITGRRPIERNSGRHQRLTTEWVNLAPS